MSGLLLKSECHATESLVASMPGAEVDIEFLEPPMVQDQHYIGVSEILWFQVEARLQHAG